jgi:hypothetical protein
LNEMGVDYGTLSTWMTPDLMLRDNVLMARTRVMGMSQTAAIIHIVAFVCTSGTSLPINLAFCIWHRHRYRKVKKERKWIRQILGTRNVAYQGRGHWVNVNPNPNASPHWNATPTGAQCVSNPAPGPQWVYNNPTAGHLVQGTPSAGHWVQPTPGIGQTVHVTPIEEHWVQPTLGIGQTVHVAPMPHANNDLNMQFAQAAVNGLQQDFGNNNDYNQDSVAYDQSSYNC